MKLYLLPTQPQQTTRNPNANTPGGSQRDEGMATIVASLASQVYRWDACSEFFVRRIKEKENGEFHGTNPSYIMQAGGAKLG